MNVNFKIAGDKSVLVIFGNEINAETSKSVRKLAEIIDSRKLIGIEEVILGYTNLLVHYNPLIIPYDELIRLLKSLITKIDLADTEQHRLIEIPVFYGEELGPDLSDVARINNLTEEEVIEIHTEPSYIVYFMGFTPGFPFLGGMSERIATPRLENPRTRIKAGSIGIANNQTGIYPVNSPGGWRLIGHTPVTLYDPTNENPFLLSPGDVIKFKAISRETYEELNRSLNPVTGGDDNI